LGVEHFEDLVDRRGLAILVAAVDDDRQAGLAGDADLRLEGAPLVGGAGGLVVVVDPGLADRPHLLVRGETGDLLSFRVVESTCLGRVSADAGEDLLVALGGPYCDGVLLTAETDVEHALDACLERVRDQLGLGPIAEEQMRVGIDHESAQPSPTGAVDFLLA